MDKPYIEMSFEIDTIRTACFRVLGKKHFIVPCTHRLMADESGCPFSDDSHMRPIRLADILATSLENGSGPDWFDEYVIPLVDLWDLKDDDLSHQSQKFYEMAYILLK